MPLSTFLEVARSLNQRGVIGRFSTFLEHVKPNAAGERVTKFNALFHWAVPDGREIDAGREVGRFHIMTHAYWREGGPEFGNVNVMGVAHGTDSDLVLAHKAAIDEHLDSIGIPVSYTNVFWGGRSEIKPSEISPFAYREWCKGNGIEPGMMEEQAHEHDSHSQTSGFRHAASAGGSKYDRPRCRDYGRRPLGIDGGTRQAILEATVAGRVGRRTGVHPAILRRTQGDVFGGRFRGIRRFP